MHRGRRCHVWERRMRLVVTVMVHQGGMAGIAGEGGGQVGEGREADTTWPYYLAPSTTTHPITPFVEPTTR